MTHDVIVQPQAEREFEELFSYIAERSPKGAAVWANAFHTAVKALRNDPESRALAPESSYYDKDIRQIIFKTRRGLPYRVLFLIRLRQVLIIHIRGPGQDLIDIDDIELPKR